MRATSHAVFEEAMGLWGRTFRFRALLESELAEMERTSKERTQ
jgi:hypothetical protein